MQSGAVAQLGERMTGSHEVRGSIPLGSTKFVSVKPSTDTKTIFHISFLIFHFSLLPVDFTDHRFVDDNEISKMN